MAPMELPARTARDHLGEYVTTLALLCGTLARMAREVYTLMKPEYGEVEEAVPAGAVGSSTMPQKRNPKLCMLVLATHRARPRPRWRRRWSRSPPSTRRTAASTR